QRLIANRGFELWPQLNPLEAIVLESFVPAQFPDPRDLEWFDHTIEKDLWPQRGLDLFSIRYESAGRPGDQLEPEVKNKIAQLDEKLQLLNVKTLQLNVGLSQWPEQLA